MNPTLVRLMLSGWVYLAFYVCAKQYLWESLAYHSALIPLAVVTVGMFFAVWQPALSDHRLVRTLQSVGIIVLGYLVIGILTRTWPQFAVYEGDRDVEFLSISIGLFLPALFSVVVALPLALFSPGKGRHLRQRLLDPAAPLPPLPPATGPGSVPPASSGP